MKITLQAWAAAEFDPPPSISTLRQWAKLGLIVPAPIKVGRTWMVESTAQYRVASTPMNGGTMSARARTIFDATDAPQTRRA